MSLLEKTVNNVTKQDLTSASTPDLLAFYNRISKRATKSFISHARGVNTTIKMVELLTGRPILRFAAAPLQKTSTVVTMTPPASRPDPAHASGIASVLVTEHMSFNVGKAVEALWHNSADATAQSTVPLLNAVTYLQREIARIEKLRQSKSTSAANA